MFVYIIAVIVRNVVKESGGITVSHHLVQEAEDDSTNTIAQAPSTLLSVT